jgi:hypothetical protein
MTRGQYKIGQVLFVVPKDKAAVVPVQVVEEVLRKTLKGEDVVYTVSWRVGREVKTSELGNVAGEVFDNPQRLRRTLLKRSSTAIERMVAVACKRAEEYGFKASVEKPAPSDTPVQPGDLKPPRRKRANGAAEVAQGDDPLEVSVDEQGEFVMTKLDDGTNVRVRM